MLQNTQLRLVVALLFGLAAWALIIYKAFAIPITHDELATITYYYKYSPWEIMMYPDPWPNNHILNTLLAKLCMNIFGQEQWAARLPNVLSFALYFYAAYRICRNLFSSDNLLFWSGLALFLFNPFLLDFFSLCRGYGLSNALMLFSTMLCLEGFLKRRERLLWWSLLFAVLASYANFTLLIFWCAINGMLAIYYLNEYAETKNIKQLLIKGGMLLGATLAYLTLIYNPIHKMQSTDQFVYWQSNGFFQDTIISLVDNSRYGSKMIDIPNEYYAILAVFIFFVAGAYTMYYWGKTSRKDLLRMPLFIAFGILALTVFVNIMQTVILKTPNLTTRTALSYYPLFILLISTILYPLYNVKPILIRWLSAVVMIIMIWHLGRTMEYDRVREWWYDANTFQVMDILKAKKPAQGAVITLSTGWHFHRSFSFYTETGKAPWLKLSPYNKEIDTLSTSQYYYIFDSDYPLLQNRYDIIAKFDGGSRLLLKRKN